MGPKSIDLGFSKIVKKVNLEDFQSSGRKGGSEIWQLPVKMKMTSLQPQLANRAHSV